MNRLAAACIFVSVVATVAAVSPALGGGSRGALVRPGSAASSVARRHCLPRSNVVTRRAPPFRRAHGPIVIRRHTRPGSTIVFFGSPFVGGLPFGYTSPNYFFRYPYSSPYYTFTAPPPFISLPPIATDPYYCWVDGIGFTQRQPFVEHLHEVHGVPPEEALASAKLVGGRYVFFGD